MINYDTNEVSGCHPLRAHLAFAVPLYIAQLEYQGGPTEYQVFEAQRRGIGESDTMLYGGEPGEAAELVDRLAEILAIMAFIPGGIEAFGFKFAAGAQNETA